MVMQNNHHHPKSKNTGVTVAATSSGASATVLYTCPAKNKGEVNLLTVSNPTSSAINVTVEIYNSQATAYYSIVNTFSIAANSVIYVVNEGDTILLNPTDKVVVSASTGGSLTSYISVRETYGEALA
jgi:hypothetical protein